MFLIVKIIVLESASSFSTPAEAKTECFVYLSFNSALQSIYGILRDRQKMLRYFSNTAIVAFFRTELFICVTVLSNNLALYSKDLLALVFVVSASKLVASSSEYN